MLNAIAQERGIGGNVIRKKLQHVVGKSLLAALIPLTNNRTKVCRQCYQIFGIDVLIDSFGNPYVEKVATAMLFYQVLLEMDQLHITCCPQKI